MRTGSTHALCALALLAFACGCSSPLDTYVCTTNADCQDDDQQGICESTLSCSFADSTCDSGRRYGSAAGELSKACVDGDVADGGVDAAIADGGPEALDAGLTDAALDAGLTDAALDAAPPCSIFVTTSITDEPTALNLMRISVDGTMLGDCQASPQPAAFAVSEQCQWCVPSGAQILIEMIAEQNLTFVFDDCSAQCPSDATCTFTATQDCSVNASFSDQLVPR
jgi:hypothetical protein